MIAEGIDFLGAQCVEDQTANGVDMTRCCLFDGSGLRCDHNEGAPAVLGALYALHRRRDSSGVTWWETRLRSSLQEPGQIGNLHPALRAIGEVHQHLEVRHRQAGIIV